MTAIGSSYTASYDPAGNMSCRAPTNTTTWSGGNTGAVLTYDNAGRLAAWQNAPGGSPSSSTLDLYDGEGNRVAQFISSVTQTMTATYVSTIVEVSTTAGITITTTTYYAAGKRIAQAVNGVFNYLGSDGLGSAEVALDASGNAQAGVIHWQAGWRAGRTSESSGAWAGQAKGMHMADVRVRAARAADKAPVLAFCERASEDGDYLASTWDGWLSDARGALLVAEQAGQPVGVAHLHMVTEQEGWLEGLRVDPLEQRHGIGGLLVAAVLNAAKDRGAWVVRLFTSSDNAPARRLFERQGFEQVAQFVTYEAEAVLGALAQAVTAGATLRTARVDERDALWAFLGASNLVPLNGGLLLDGWTAHALTPAVLQERLAAGAVQVLEAWGAIQGMAIVEQRLQSHRGPTLRAQYIDGMAEGIGRLALALRERAARMGLDRVVISVPDVLILHDAMDGAGYERAEQGGRGEWCYAYRLRPS